MVLDAFLDPNVPAEALASSYASEPCSAVGAEKVAGNRAPMLELHHREGHRNAIAYSHLLWLAFDPSIGISLHFATHKVRIRGRNLHRVYEQLADQSCRILREASPGEDDGEDEATFISSLVFRPIRRGEPRPPAGRKRQSTKKD